MLLLAHRGLRGPGRPENSAAAVEAARRAGADGSEVDLRLAADGVLVVAHDEELTRLGHPGLEVSRTPAGRLPLARLADVVDAAGDGRLVLELKRPPSAPGAVLRTVRALAAELRALGLPGSGPDVVVSSFAPALLDGVRASGLPLRTALLGRPHVGPRLLVALAVQGGHDEVHPHVRALSRDPGAVVLAHGLGLTVTPWTVNARTDARLLAGAGCAAAISDVPDQLRPHLTGA